MTPGIVFDYIVIPAKAGILHWLVGKIPAFAGMTEMGAGMTEMGAGMTEMGAGMTMDAAVRHIEMAFIFVTWLGASSAIFIFDELNGLLNQEAICPDRFDDKQDKID